MYDILLYSHTIFTRTVIIRFSSYLIRQKYISYKVKEKFHFVFSYRQNNKSSKFINFMIIVVRFARNFYNFSRGKGELQVLYSIWMLKRCLIFRKIQFSFLLPNEFSFPIVFVGLLNFFRVLKSSLLIVQIDFAWNVIGISRENERKIFGRLIFHVDIEDLMGALWKEIFNFKHQELDLN